VFPRDCVFPGLSGGHTFQLLLKVFRFKLKVRNSPLQKYRGLPLSAFLAVELPYFTSNKLRKVPSTAVFGINPLPGAMGLVLTRLSRSSNTLKEVHWG
jgi:hypothetical protein